MTASNRKALIVWGGWDGHEPKPVAEIFRRVLTEEGFEVEVSDTLDVFKDEAKLMGLSLVVPCWTMGKISNEQLKPVMNAVKSGVGLAGCHGGMCDAFRECCGWQFMTGGQFVDHPGGDGTRYRVRITAVDHTITKGIKDFDIASEQYYMHVDPAVKVLAVTRFPVVEGPHSPNGPVDMPVIWSKFWGAGRVFYNSLGHVAKVVDSEPILTLMRRGCLWAAR